MVLWLFYWRKGEVDMEVSTGQIVLYFFKAIPVLDKVFTKVSSQMLNGIWCSCWQYGKDEEYQIGTMVIRQLGSAVQAQVYSSSGMWNYKGTFKDNWLSARFGTKAINGRIDLEVSDNGRNTDRLIGSWSGLVDLPTENPHELERKYIKNLPHFASRRKCVNYKCHVKRFEAGEGICTRSV